MNKTLIFVGILGCSITAYPMSKEKEEFKVITGEALPETLAEGSVDTYAETLAQIFRDLPPAQQTALMKIMLQGLLKSNMITFLTDEQDAEVKRMVDLAKKISPPNEKNTKKIGRSPK